MASELFVRSVGQPYETGFGQQVGRELTTLSKVLLAAVTCGVAVGLCRSRVIKARWHWSAPAGLATGVATSFTLGKMHWSIKVESDDEDELLSQMDRNIKEKFIEALRAAQVEGDRLHGLDEVVRRFEARENPPYPHLREQISDRFRVWRDEPHSKIALREGGDYERLTAQYVEMMSRFKELMEMLDHEEADTGRIWIAFINCMCAERGRHFDTNRVEQVMSSEQFVDWMAMLEATAERPEMTWFGIFTNLNNQAKIAALIVGRDFDPRLERLLSVSESFRLRWTTSWSGAPVKRLCLVQNRFDDWFYHLEQMEAAGNLAEPSFVEPYVELMVCFKHLMEQFENCSAAGDQPERQEMRQLWACIVLEKILGDIWWVMTTDDNAWKEERAKRMAQFDPDQYTESQFVEVVNQESWGEMVVAFERLVADS